MTAQNSISALLNQIYDVKFSKHTPLVVVLLSMVYTVYRTRHYLGSAFSLDALVAWPTAIFIELLVLAASAAMFIALRSSFLAELKGIDKERSAWGVRLAMASLGAAFTALLFVAWADAYALTQAIVPTVIMSLIQVTQMIFLLCFVIAADLDERERLRHELADYRRQAAQDAAGSCPYCHKPVAANNRKRHMDACPMRP